MRAVAGHTLTHLDWLEAEAIHILSVRARVASIDARLDIHALVWDNDGGGVNLNDIARVQVKTQQALVADSYRANRDTGSFILIDEATNDTVAAGMID